MHEIKKNVNTKAYYHSFDITKLQEGATIISRKIRELKIVKLVMNIREYEWYKAKFADGHIDWIYILKIQRCQIEMMMNIKVTGILIHLLIQNLLIDSIHTISYLRYGLSTPENHIAEILKEAGLESCRQTVLKNDEKQLSNLLLH